LLEDETEAAGDAVPGECPAALRAKLSKVRKLAGGLYSGRFANAPVHFPGRRIGDLVTFKDADISDWMFMRNGKIVGRETIKPLLKSMPKADADALRARMETP